MSHTPSRSTHRTQSLSDGEGTGHAGAKRKRSGTVRGRVAPASLSTLGTTLPGVEGEVGLGDPGQSVLSTFGTLDLSNAAMASEAYGLLASALGESLREGVPSGNCVFARFILADKQDQWALTRQVLRALNDGLEPTFTTVSNGPIPMKLWCRALPQNPPNARRVVQNKTLLEDVGILHRYTENRSVINFLLDGMVLTWIATRNNRSFVIFGQMALFWPPPIVIGPSDAYDISWSFTVACPTEELSVIKAIGMALELKYNGMFCRRVRRALKTNLGSSVLTQDLVKQRRSRARRFLAPPLGGQGWNADCGPRSGLGLVEGLHVWACGAGVGRSAHSLWVLLARDP
jgi:hypothetical protein